MAWTEEELTIFRATSESSADVAMAAVYKLWLYIQMQVIRNWNTKIKHYAYFLYILNIDQHTVAKTLHQLQRIRDGDKMTNMCILRSTYDGPFRQKIELFLYSAAACQYIVLSMFSEK